MDSDASSEFCNQSRINVTSTMKTSETNGTVRRKADDRTTINQKTIGQKTVGHDLSGQRIVGQDDV